VALIVTAVETSNLTKKRLVYTELIYLGRILGTATWAFKSTGKNQM
jgi:hypothetical protein